MTQITSIWHVYLIYGIIIGSGTAVTAPIYSNIARWFSKRRTATTSALVAANGLGGTVVPLIANQLLDSFGWKSAFAILGVINLVLIITASLFLKKSPPHQEPVSLAPNKPAVFQSSGLSLRDSLRVPQFWWMCIMLIGFGVAATSIMIHGVPHMTDLGISPTNAARVLSFMNVMTIPGSLGLGVLGGKLGNHRLYFLCFALMFFCIILLLGIGDLKSFYIFGFFFGLAVGAGSPQLSPLIANIFGMKSHGLLLGIFFMCITLGTGAGNFFLGFLYDITGSYRTAFIICIIMCFIGALATFFLKPVKKLNQ